LPFAASFLDYAMPTIADSPPIEVQIVEARDPHGPFGAKEASEGALAGFLPALTAALADAVGVRMHELPVTSDRLFEELRKRRRAERLKAA
jgi:4-hydroxybenzoyl-CoA reductase subunit alpha